MNLPVTPLRHLPDVACFQPPPSETKIDWVGMNNISLPINLEKQPCQAQVDIAIDLPIPSAKGIHMSRLYRLLQQHLTSSELTPVKLDQMLQAVIASHSDLASTTARLNINADLLLERPALVSDLSGWKRYPIVLTAHCSSGVTRIHLQVGVDYSSTCPCSAALSRQLLQQAFLAQWQDQPISADEVAEWLAEHGSYATPHSQRSRAWVKVAITEQSLDIVHLINTIETALGTPVQTAVKRIDEQAFARLNGANLMYVEDAVRRLNAALEPHFSGAQIQVIHCESLHQHDATASINIPPL